MNQYYGPDYELDVRSSNMENANSYEYLEKIKIAVIENLKKTAAVPSVQMQDVPRQSLGMSDDQEAELDDLDEDENKDVRMTQRQWEKHVERQDEFEESDDEDMARANGVCKPNGRSRQETDFGNINNDDTMDVDSGIATPAEPATEPAADNDDTMIDEAQAENAETAEVAEVIEAAEAPAAPATEADKPAATEQNVDAEKPKVDSDGDVDMAEAADDKSTDATIKKEEVDGISSAAEAAEPKKNSPAPENAEQATDGNDEPAAATEERASASPAPGPAAEAKPAEDAAAAPVVDASEKDAASSAVPAAAKPADEKEAGKA